MNAPSRGSKWRPILIIAALFSSNIFSFMCLGIMAPLFPRVAEMKYMSSTVSGWVFGVFSLTQFAISPMAGMLIPSVGARFLLLAGTFLAGGCTILFGFLDRVPVTEDNNVVFTVLCFLLRIFLSLGCTACNTATFAIAVHTYPDNASTVMGFLETAVGLGLFIGPGIGGFLYEAGGFLLPFLMVGVCLIVSAPMYYLILPQNIGDGEEEEECSSILALLKVPVIFMVMITLIVSASPWLALDPVLQPFLQRFDLSASQVGLVFLLFSGTWVLLAPLSGRLADSMDNSTPLIIIGFAILSVGLLLIGPSPLIGLGSYSELWLVLVSLIILGAGMSLAVIPTYGKVLKAAEEYGFPDNMGTKGAVAGLWTSVNAFGEFIGPIYSGAACEAMGFQWTMTCLAIATLLMFFLSVVLYLYESKKSYTELTDGYFKL